MLLKIKELPIKIQWPPPPLILGITDETRLDKGRPVRCDLILAFQKTAEKY